MLNNAKSKGDRRESVKSIINSLLKLTKGHERYPHDTVKIDGYPRLETDCCANRDEAIAKWNELTNKHSNKKSEVRNEAT